MGLSAAHVQTRFENSCGLEPLFRPVDGSNNPTANTSTMDDRRDAYSLLLNKGLIRVQLPVPATAQFEVVAVEDPYGNSTGQSLPLTQISVFRRPLPATNLKFLGAISAAAPPSAVATPGIMWDGREIQTNPFIALMNQANNATLIHAEAGSALSAAVLTSIVDFALSLFTCTRDRNSGRLGQHRGCERRHAIPLDGAVHGCRKSRPEPDQAGRLPLVRSVGPARSSNAPPSHAGRPSSTSGRASILSRRRARATSPMIVRRARSPARRR